MKQETVTNEVAGRSIEDGIDHPMLAWAITAHKSGDLAKAEELYRQVIKEAPRTVDAWHWLGLALAKTGRINGALDCLDRAISLEPSLAKLHSNKAVILAGADRNELAIASYNDAIKLDPGYAEAYNNRGNLNLKIGNSEAAIADYEHALELDADYQDARLNRGRARFDQGQFDAALDDYHAIWITDESSIPACVGMSRCLENLERFDEALEGYDIAIGLDSNHVEALEFKARLLLRLDRSEEAIDAIEDVLHQRPEFADGFILYGNILTDIGDNERALLCFERAAMLQPEDAQAQFQYGIQLQAIGRLDEAIAAYDVAIHLDPDLIGAHNNRGVAFYISGRYAEAEAATARATELDPDFVEAKVNHANALAALKRGDEAAAEYLEAIKKQPDLAGSYTNLGRVLMEQGRVELAVKHFVRACELEPTDKNLVSNLLFCLNFDSSIDDETIVTSIQKLGARFRPEVSIERHFEPEPNKRQLKVGLVSADFGAHPIGYMLKGFLKHLNQNRISVTCYSGRTKHDDVTDEIKSAVPGWFPTIGQSDEALADRIQRDGIDILIDLAGHTAGNRLMAFTLRPAPLQLTWMGACHTTGIREFDYTIMDPHYVAPGTEHWFNEKIARMPDIRWCYEPPHYIPDVTTPPSLHRGYVTFGSFNNLAKLNDEVLTLWADVLKAVDRSRLLLSWKTLEDKSQITRLSQFMATQGIDTDRLRFSSGADTHEGVLEEYSDVDVCLDPFPFSGCLTSFEAMWMGLPVVTMPQDRPCSRQTFGQVMALGHPEWVAQSKFEYVQIAKELALNPALLRDMRRRQRERLEESPLGNGKQFAKNFEALLRDLWSEHCQQMAGADQ